MARNTERQVSKRGRKTAKGVRPLLWFAVPARWRSVPVYLTHHSLTPELKSTELGVTDLTREGSMSIHIDASISRDLQDTIVVHELVHANLWGQKIQSREEERIASELGQELTRSLKSMGFRLPPRPRGIAALESYARAHGRGEGK